MTSRTENQFFLSRPTFAEQLKTLVLPFARDLWIWLARSKSRRDLMKLDDHLLRDIGLTRAEAKTESGKPFWEF